MLGTQVFMTYLCTLWWISKADNFKFRVIFPMVWVKQWILFLFAVGFSYIAMPRKVNLVMILKMVFFFILRWFMVCFIALKIFKTKSKNSIKIHWTFFLFCYFLFLFVIMESIVIIAFHFKVRGGIFILIHESLQNRNLNYFTYLTKFTSILTTLYRIYSSNGNF